MNDPRSDPELISQTRAGDAAAFGVLWQRHQPAAWRAARALTSDKAAAEDAVGETFGAIHAALLNGAGPDIHFRAYMLTALRNNVARGARKDAAVVPSAQVPEPAVLDDPLGDTPEKAAAVAAYQTLPERYRAVLWHAEIEGEPMVTVAKAVGTTPAAAAQLLVRARRHLRRAYVQAHISGATAAARSDECRVAREHMGGYFVGGLPARQTARLEDHVHTCIECKKVLGWASEAGAGLKAAIVPYLLGGAAATKYLGGATGLWGGAKAAGAAGRQTIRKPAGASAVAALILLALLGSLAGAQVISIFPASLFSSTSHHATEAAYASATGTGATPAKATADPAPIPAPQITPAATSTTTTSTPAPRAAATTFTTAPPMVVRAPSSTTLAATPSTTGPPSRRAPTTTHRPTTSTTRPAGTTVSPAPSHPTTPTTTRPPATTTTVPPAPKSPARAPTTTTTTIPAGSTTAPPCHALVCVNVTAPNKHHKHPHKVQVPWLLSLTLPY